MTYYTCVHFFQEMVQRYNVKRKKMCLKTTNSNLFSVCLSGIELCSVSKLQNYLFCAQILFDCFLFFEPALVTSRIFTYVYTLTFIWNHCCLDWTWWANSTKRSWEMFIIDTISWKAPSVGQQALIIALFCEGPSTITFSFTPSASNGTTQQ